MVVEMVVGMILLGVVVVMPVVVMGKEGREARVPNPNPQHQAAPGYDI